MYRRCYDWGSRENIGGVRCRCGCGRRGDQSYDFSKGNCDTSGLSNPYVSVNHGEEPKKFIDANFEWWSREYAVLLDQSGSS